MKKFFKRVAQKSGKKKAIVAAARKLIGKARAAVRDSKKYEYEVPEKEAA